MTIYHRNYLKLLRLLPDLDQLRAGAFLRLEAAGFMPLTVDVLHRDGNRLPLALAHHFEARGDLVPDPAETLGATAGTLGNWELWKAEPEVGHLPAILAFPGFDPRPERSTLGERVKRRRED